MLDKFVKFKNSIKTPQDTHVAYSSASPWMYPLIFMHDYARTQSGQLLAREVIRLAVMKMC